MAIELSLQGLLDDFRLEAFFGIHLLEPAVLLLQLSHAGHQGDIHAAVLATPLVEGGAADVVLSA